MPKKKRRCPQCGARTAVSEPRCRVCAHLFLEDGVAPTAGTDRAAFGGGVLSKGADEVPQPPSPQPRPEPTPSTAGPDAAEPLSWEEAPDLVGPVTSTARPAAAPPAPAADAEHFDPDALLRDLGGDLPRPAAAAPPPPLPPQERFDPNAIFEDEEQ